MNSELLFSEKVYRIPPFLRISFLVLPFMGLALLIFGFLTFLPALNESFEDSVASTLVGLAAFVILTCMYAAIKRVRLILTDDGITYYGLGFRIYTPWPNIIGIVSIQPYPFPLNFRKILGLQLRQHSVLGMKLVEGKLQGKAVLETDWWNPASTMGSFAGMLPITPVAYGRNWKESKLGLDLQQYAPWAFVE